MPNNTANCCPTCGNGLQESGVCNVCLLQLGISQAEAEEPAEIRSDLVSVDELNKQFPQLEISRLIGQGGMGAIYHARQTSLDRDVALKLIAREVSSDAAFVERFEREAKTLAKLSHPNIVTIFDFGRTDDGRAYLIMEYVDGINLRDAISSGDIGSDDALEVVSTICKALEYAHSKGVVHRDIKPENILLGEDGSLKVADFGIAKIVDKSVRALTLTGSRQVLGSMHYLAPEHLEAREEVDHRVDLYALGVIFYELLTGQLPLGRFEAPSAIGDRVDRRLDAIVLKSLSRKPQQRYQTATELSSDIGAVLASKRDHRVPETVGLAAEASHMRADAKRFSVPFTGEAMGGFAETVGMLHANQDSLKAEFCIRDGFFSAVKSKTHVVEIPRTELTRLELVSGIFSSKLVISAESISSLGGLPDAETGSVELSIKRTDEEYARGLVSTLGFGSADGASAPGAAANRRVGTSHYSGEWRVVFAVLMIVASVLNAIGIVVLLSITFRAAFSEANLGVAMGTVILIALVVGLIAMVQLVTGVLNFFARPRLLSILACVVSMLPVTPVWILSFPLAVWSLYCLTREYQLTSNERPPADTNWGTTTMLWVRESRWSKVIGAANAVAVALVVAAFVAFNSGYYPSEMHYRIVSGDAKIEAVRRAVQSRLSTSVRSQYIAFDDPIRPTRINVSMWKRQHDQIASQLSVQSSPQLVWLAAQSESDDRDSQPSVQQGGQSTPTVPLASEIDTSLIRIEELPMGLAAQARGTPFDLSSDLVGGVSVNVADGKSKLVISLTSAGREQIASDVAEKEGAGGLGLVIDGIVEGIAKPSDVTHKQAVFEMSTDSDQTIDGIMASIRGPEIPTKLELID